MIFNKDNSLGSKVMLKFQYIGSTKSVWLIGPVMKVGSSKSNELILSEDAIAPLHCYIHITPQLVEIEPVADNEVYVNEVLIKKKSPLKLGDTVRIGIQEFLMLDPQSKASITPAAVQQPVVSSEATVFRAPVSVEAPAQSAGSGWVIQGLHKSLKNKRYPINGVMYLGRSQDCELHFSYERLSRKHAEFKVLDNTLVLKDLDSSNGTYHNGEKIKQAKLRGGDTIAFDKLDFLVVAPSASGESSDGQNVNQTMVRSALTPEMLKQGAKSTNNSDSSGVSSNQPKNSAANLLMITAGVVLLLVVAVVMFLK